MSEDRNVFKFLFSIFLVPEAVSPSVFLTLLFIYACHGLDLESPSGCLTPSLAQAAPALKLLHTVEPRFNEPLQNDVLGITNDIPGPEIVKYMEKNLDVQ